MSSPPITGVPKLFHLTEPFECLDVSLDVKIIYDHHLFSLYSKRHNKHTEFLNGSGIGPLNNFNLKKAFYVAPRELRRNCA